MQSINGTESKVRSWDVVDGKNKMSGFILDDTRRLCFRLVLKCIFRFKSNRLCNPKNVYLGVFFWYKQDQKGTGGTDTYSFNGPAK